VTMTYSQFEDELLVASVQTADAAIAANPNSHGQVDASTVAESVLPGVSERWVRDAVKSFESNGWVYNVVVPLSGGVVFMVTGPGRRKAESLG
jgi:hypothetical protein